jgi:hypothetical protein
MALLVGSRSASFYGVGSKMDSPVKSRLLFFNLDWSKIFLVKEIGLEVNADKTKYMIMSRDQNAGRSYGVKIDNSSIERVEEFRYLGTTLTNENSI